MHSEQKIQTQKNGREVNQMLSTKAALGTAAKQEHLFIMLLSGAARANKSRQTGAEKAKGGMKAL